MATDVADRSFGNLTSEGYADNVPVYFRRGSVQTTENPSDENCLEDLIKPEISTQYLWLFEKVESQILKLHQYISQYDGSARRKLITASMPYRHCLESIDIQIKKFAFPENIAEYLKQRVKLEQKFADKVDRNILKNKNRGCDD